MKFHVLVNEFKAAVLFSSTDESRFVLNSVHFVARPNRQPIMVSTDGRRLAVIETQADNKESNIFDEVAFTVSADFLKPLCAFAGKHSLTLTLEPHLPDRIIFVMPSLAVDSEKGAIVDCNGGFPNWEQVLPQGEKESVNEIGFNAELMADFAKAAKLLCAESPGLRVNLFSEDSAMEIKIAGKPNFYGVLMPTRSIEAEKWQPEFLFTAKTVPLKAA